MGDPVVEKAVLALDDRTVKLDDRVETIEGKVRKDQAETIREHGLPADLVATETNALRRHSPARNRWPEIAAFDERVGELEQRQVEINTELRELLDREQAAPNADAAALAEWEINDRKGPRPEATLPAIQARIEGLQADSEALNLAIGRVLADKAAYVDKHRGRLVKKADQYTDEAHARYLQLVDELEAQRDDLRAARHASVWAKLYPNEKASAEPRDSLAGGRKRALTQLGVSAEVSPVHTFAALREDARYLADAATPEQKLIIAGRDPRQPPNTEWHDTPEARAKRTKAAVEWVGRP